MKKRIITLALALVMVLTLAVPAMAGTINVDTAPKAVNNTLTYAVASTYTVTIPEAVTLATATGIGTAEEITVANSFIPFGTSLTVTITDSANYDTGFRLKDVAGANYIGYLIKDAIDVPVVKDTAFLTVPAGTHTGSATLTFTADTPTISGTYLDVITFTVAVA